ncbi:transposase [Pantoea sp. Eser]|nr:transposase [Pantoea sp. Eser]
MKDAKKKVEYWWQQYNKQRPHYSLNNQG